MLKYLQYLIFADERLAENYFKEVMEEKAEMLRMYLEDLGNPLIFSSHCGYTMVTFKFYSYDNGRLSQIALYFFQCGRLRRSVLLLMGTT